MPAQTSPVSRRCKHYCSALKLDALAKLTEIGEEPSLIAARLLVAREVGFSSWVKLRPQVGHDETDPGNAAIRQVRKRRGFQRVQPDEPETGTGPLHDAIELAGYPSRQGTTTVLDANAILAAARRVQRL